MFLFFFFTSAPSNTFFPLFPSLPVIFPASHSLFSFLSLSFFFFLQKKKIFFSAMKEKDWEFIVIIIAAEKKKKAKLFCCWSRHFNFQLIWQINCTSEKWSRKKKKKREKNFCCHQLYKLGNPSNYFKICHLFFPLHPVFFFLPTEQITLWWHLI